VTGFGVVDHRSPFFGAMQESDFVSPAHGLNQGFVSMIKIRKMIPADLDQAIAILAKWNMAPIKPSNEVPNPERADLDVTKSFVAFDGNQILGVSSYILLSDTTAETASLAVDPAYKGKGIGSMLQIARLKEMKRIGITKVRTETDRPETIQWYIKVFGYKVIGKNPKKHVFSNPDIAEWTVLELNLNNGVFSKE